MALARTWESVLLGNSSSSTSESDGSSKIIRYSYRYSVSNDVGQCAARARRILAYRHPYIVWGRCWAHQVNGMVHTLMDKIPLFLDVCRKAHAVATFLKDPNHGRPWLEKLRVLCASFYGDVDDDKKKKAQRQRQQQECEVPQAPLYLTIPALRHDGWNSALECFSSQLRIQGACKALLLRTTDDAVEQQQDWMEPATDVPSPLKVWAAAAGSGYDSSEKKNNNEKDDDYWKELTKAEQLIRPFCNASLLLQQNESAHGCNTLANVLFLVLVIYRSISEYSTRYYSHSNNNNNDDEGREQVHEENHPRVLLNDQEQRWARQTEDHPLVFLAFAVHPAYRNVAARLLEKSEAKYGNWNRKQNNLSVARMVQAAKFYYRKYELCKREHISYKNKKDDDDEDMRREHEEEELVEELSSLETSVKKWLLGVKIDVDVFCMGDSAIDW